MLRQEMPTKFGLQTSTEGENRGPLA